MPSPARWPWPLWVELAATTNRQHWAYAATVRGLLEREGYQLIEAGSLTPDAQTEAQQIAAQLQEISADAQDAADLAVRSAELLSDAEALELQRKRRHSPAQRAQLARWRIAKAWGLGEATPSTAVLEADRQQLSQRLRFGWTLGSIAARQLQARADQATAARLSHQGKAWRPDLCRDLVGPRITAADALGLPDWLTRGDWVTARDPRLLELQARATACRGDLAQVLGVSPGKTGTATLRRLLRLTGRRLEAERVRNGPDRGDYRYRVVAEALPGGVMVERLQGVWAHSAAG